MAGRPPIGEKVELRLGPDLMERVSLLLEQEREHFPRISRAGVLRCAIDRALSSAEVFGMSAFLRKHWAQARVGNGHESAPWMTPQMAVVFRTGGGLAEHVAAVEASVGGAEWMRHGEPQPSWSGGEAGHLASLECGRFWVAEGDDPEPSGGRHGFFVCWVAEWPLGDLRIERLDRQETLPDGQRLLRELMAKMAKMHIPPERWT